MSFRVNVWFGEESEARVSEEFDTLQEAVRFLEAEQSHEDAHGSVYDSYRTDLVTGQSEGDLLPGELILRVRQATEAAQMWKAAPSAVRHLLELGVHKAIIGGQIPVTLFRRDEGFPTAEAFGLEWVFSSTADLDNFKDALGSAAVVYHQPWRD